MELGALIALLCYLLKSDYNLALFLAKGAMF